MKGKKLLVVFLAIALSILSFSAYAVGLSDNQQYDLSKKISPENDIYTITYDSAVIGRQYGIAVLNEVITNEAEINITDENLVYADQVTAESSHIVKSIYMPDINGEVYTVVIGDSTQSDLKIVGYITDIVTVPVESVALNYTSVAVAIGKQMSLDTEIFPNNASNMLVTWSSDNPDVAEVDNEGVVTGKAEGTAVITVTTEDGEKTAQCSVLVNERGIDYSLPIIEAATAEGSKEDLTAVDIILKNNPGLTELSFEIEYDGDNLGINRTEDNNIFPYSTYSINSKNPYSLSFTSDETMEESGVIATVYFYAKEKALENEEYPVTILLTGAKNGNSNVNLQILDGTVTYRPGTQESDTPTAKPTKEPEEDKPTSPPESSPVPTEEPTPEPDKTPDPNPAIPTEDPNAAAIEIATITGTVGKEVTVPVTLKNNPGIEAAQLQLTYNNALSLVSARRGDALAGLTNYTQSGRYDLYPFNMMWDGTDNDNSNGDLLYLTFKINDDAEPGDYGIYLSFDKGNIYNHDLENVPISITQGTVHVISYLPGDINGDGQVTVKDVTTLRRTIVGGWDLYVVVPALDVNKDGSVSVMDATILSRYITGGWDIELK